MRRKSQKSPPAVLAGTSSQFLRARSLPKILRSRLVVVVLGPRGVGKTSVAKRILGGVPLVLRGDRLHAACAKAVRRGRWPDDVATAPRLVLDGPEFLNRRKGVLRLLHELLVQRTQLGVATVACQGSDDTVLYLLDAVEPRLRCTVNLRMPSQTGRRRFLRQVASQQGVPWERAREVRVDEPWTYRKVSRSVHRLRRQTQDEDG